MHKQHHSCLTTGVAGPVLSHGSQCVGFDVVDIEGVEFWLAASAAVAAVLREVLGAGVVQVGPKAMQREASSPANAGQSHRVATWQ